MAADAFSSFKMPTAYTLPTRIAIDKANTVWFIESNLNKMAGFRPAKAVFSETRYSHPSSSPSDITISNTGKLWLTESNSNRSGYSILSRWHSRNTIFPPIASEPGRIASDAKGNIWFTEFYAIKWHVRPQERGIPGISDSDTQQSSVGIVVDKKGHGYGSESEANKLARLNPQDGAIQEFELPNATKPKGSCDRQVGRCGLAAHRARFDDLQPATKKFKTFLMPSNAQSKAWP